MSDIYLLSEGKNAVFTPQILYRNKEVIGFGVDCLMECDTINRNERVYPWELVTEALKHPFIKERLATSTWYCEAGHPVVKSIERQTTIDRLNATCILKSINVDKKPIVSGIVETMATNLGRDLRDLILYNGAVVAFSMRSLGKLEKQSSGYRVVPPLFITNWDEVVHPSVQKAYMNSVIKRDDNGKSASKLNAVSGTDQGSITAISESMLTQFMLEEKPETKDAFNWLEENTNFVKSTVNKQGVVSMSGSNGNTLVVPTRGQLRDRMSQFLSEL